MRAMNVRPPFPYSSNYQLAVAGNTYLAIVESNRLGHSQATLLEAEINRMLYQATIEILQAARISQSMKGEYDPEYWAGPFPSTRHHVVIHARYGGAGRPAPIDDSQDE